MIPYIDTHLRSWFDWAERQVSGGLGFLSSYDMKSPGGAKPGPILPEVIPPAALRPIDEAIREMRPDDWAVLVWRYGKPGKQHEQAKEINISRSLYNQRIHAAHCWLDGYIRSIRKNY